MRRSRERELLYRRNPTNLLAKQGGVIQETADGLPETATHDDAVAAAAALTDRWRGLLGAGRIPFRARAASEEFVFQVERVWLELTT